ncbi:recombinase family protein [Lysinibacillus sphaericus]|uniref:Recombinase family protein n=1 Tax=Lysinibacillus pinottii TaxID=2973932 RepID=A0ABT2DRM4_9BACI|nr:MULTISPECIES: recombinase family protein [Lysinibacillus]MBE5082943.1 recombinase family protein [Bacillus thuringiensis]MCS1397530.1 recombinase family protein [Lysinibacillus sp. PB211]MDR0159881.1 recombinase family protein [Lysinibacillus sphaericus]QPA48750.1 recombinase family protein [Lysinibacillus sphaericus]QTB16863.1 recombinase family protein [Lysinibacillus sphaericus]
MKKAALYVRVSTLHQIDKDSLPFQRQELENYAKYALNIEEVVIFEDAGYSAKNTDRPKYQEMMKRIRSGEFTHLLVWKIDRISRNLKDFSEMYEELKDCKVTFVSKNEQFDTSTAMGEAMLKIILVFAELERKLTAERVFSIMLSRAEKGLWNGATVPFGYVWSEEEKFPVIDPDESKIIQYIYNSYESLRSTLKVAYRLHEEKIATKRNGQWTAKTVRDILRNPFYIGTYRYNMRESGGSRRLKNKEEWVVVENNHPGIIEKEQFERVNKLLSDNYRGLTDVQRADIHKHIFSKMLYCGKCNSLLTAGLDAARKDGYRPSRYTCVTSGGAKRCSNYVSDIIIGPFIFNYVSNLIRLQERITPKHSLRDMERALLRGNSFIDVVGVDNESLKETHFALTGNMSGQEYSLNTKDEIEIPNIEIERLQREKTKFVRALKRLEDLYYFGEEEDAISQKEYIFKKRDLQERLEELDDEINILKQKNDDKTSDVFIDYAQHFLITKEMQQARQVDYRELSKIVGREALSDFMQTIIDNIVVIDKRVQSITFKNGITHTFAYKSLLQSKSSAPTKKQYKNYEGPVIEYLKENGPASRSDLQKATNITRDGIFTLLSELIEREIIVKTGQSTATRYHYNDKQNN